MQSETSNSISAAVGRCLTEGATAALMTLVEGDGEIGVKCLVEESGTVTGSLGSGALDSAVVEFAPVFLASRNEVRMLVSGEFAPQLAGVTARVMFERIESEPRIVICGAGHVGAALARMAATTGYRVTLIDDRGEFLSRDQFPDRRIELVTADDWAIAVRSAIAGDSTGRNDGRRRGDRERETAALGRGVSIAIVTRGHHQDEECLRAVVSMTPDYIGLIGSRRRTNIVLERMREEGADPGLLANVRAPIGLDIGAVTPEEVALAILAEIVAERRGGEGRSLSAWRRAKRD